MLVDESSNESNTDKGGFSRGSCWLQFQEGNGERILGICWEELLGAFAGYTGSVFRCDMMEAF
jgi:hypothetical protein